MDYYELISTCTVGLLIIILRNFIHRKPDKIEFMEMMLEFPIDCCGMLIFFLVTYVQLTPDDKYGISDFVLTIIVFLILIYLWRSGQELLYNNKKPKWLYYSIPSIIIVFITFYFVVEKILPNEEATDKVVTVKINNSIIYKDSSLLNIK